MSLFQWRTRTAACAVALLMGTSTVATAATMLVVDTTTPTTDVLISQPTRNTFTRAFDSDGNGTNATRNSTTGQSFTTPDILGVRTQYEVTSITVRHDNGAGSPPTGANSQNLSAFPNAVLRLWVFEYNPNTNAETYTNWYAGDGNVDNDQFDGTGITNILVNGDTFSAARDWNDDFLHFNFSAPLVLDENKAYGYTIGFDDGNGITTVNADQNSFQLQVARDPITGTTFFDPSTGGEFYRVGANIRSRATANDTNGITSAFDDMVFYVQGYSIQVPEPTSWILLGLGLLGVAACRKR